VRQPDHKSGEGGESKWAKRSNPATYPFDAKDAEDVGKKTQGLHRRTRRKKEGGLFGKFARTVESLADPLRCIGMKEESVRGDQTKKGENLP